MPRKKPQSYKPRAAETQPREPKQPPRRDGDPRLAKPLEAESRPAPGHSSKQASAHPGKPALDPHAAREAQRYEKPILSREAILSFLSQQEALLTFEQLAYALNLTEGSEREALDKRINAMLREGQLLLNRRGGLTVAERADLIPGTIIANADGFGFLRRDDGAAEDVFLAPLQMKKVLHGDRALISVTGIDRKGKPEGQIVEVLERRSPKIVGRYLDEALFGVVAPDDRRIHQDIQIPRGASMGARPGDVVVAEIVEQPTPHRPPIGRVVKIFGSDLGPQHAIDLAIQSFDLPHEFPKAVAVETSVIPPQVEAWQCKDRVDLRKLALVTIDGEDARDFDDAVYCERTKTGGFKLIVAIADVASYVNPNSALDQEAYKRSTSVYFPGRVVPMLPEFLSNGVCSLKPDEDRLCLACELSVDANGVLKRSKFFSAVMRSHARLTYTAVWNALAPTASVDEAAKRQALARIGDLLPKLQDLYALFGVLAKARAQRGAVEFEGQEVRFGFDENGAVTQVARYERNDAHRLIEECMILANVAAAKFLLKAKVPSLYRAHAAPPESRYEDAKQFLFDIGLRLPSYEQLEPKALTELLRQAKARPDKSLIEAVVLRMQSLAIYKDDNIGHFGLALDAYAHFTSPIRRYPDLLVHRAIYQALAKSENAADGYVYDSSKMMEMGKQCSARERRADEASRDVNERLKCAYMEHHIGEEFTGTVTGVTSFGVFVELDQTHISGMVHVTQLPNDYYHFDAVRKRLYGERSRAGLRLSDRVRVKLLRVDSTERKIDFKLLSELIPLPQKDLLAGRSDYRPRGAGKEPAKASAKEFAKDRTKAGRDASPRAERSNNPAGKMQNTHSANATEKVFSFAKTGKAKAKAAAQLAKGKAAAPQNPKKTTKQSNAKGRKP